MKIAITGGAGFLGYHLAKRLEGRDGHSVRLLDIAEPPAEDFDRPIEYVHCDVRDLVALKRDLQGCDAIVHAAAALPLWSREDIFTTNSCGTECVLFVARELGIPRVVHISSTAVYGVPKVHPLIETHPLVGVGPYGITKIQAEAICEKYRKPENGGLCVCVIRPKTFIGTARLGVFQILYDWVESGTYVPCIGWGNNRYQLLEVEDLVEAIVLGLTAPAEKANDTFNVGAERFGTVKEDMGALFQHAGSGARLMGTWAWPTKVALSILEKLNLSPLYKWVYGTADKDSFVSIDKIKTQLGWQPRFSNAEALIHAYDWYMANKSKIPTGSGVTHRIGWNQKALKPIKYSLKALKWVVDKIKGLFNRSAYSAAASGAGSQKHTPPGYYELPPQDRK